MLKYTKDSEVNTVLFCLSNVLKDFSVNNVKKIGLYGHVSAFSIDYDSMNIEKTRFKIIFVFIKKLHWIIKF